MDAAQWPQHQQVAGFSRPMEDIPIPNNNSNNPTSLNNNNSSKASSTLLVGGDQRKTRPQKDQTINCPRCNSTNTKFCYYNNYSLTQPRYFCKTCRRYWTHGGSLRNVPVGGGSRKNKRSSSSTSSTQSQSSISTVTNPSSIPTKLIPDLNPPSSFSHLISASQNPKFLEGHDLNLAFPIQGIFQPTNNENHVPINIMNVNTNSGNNTNNISTSTSTCNTTSSNTPISALELFRTGIASRGGLNPYVPMPMPVPVPVPDSNTLYPSGFPNLQDFKPNMNVFAHPGDHNSMVGSGENNVGSGGARLLFPFADMNKLANTTTTTGADHQQHHNEIDHDQIKGENDHHHHHHHQGHATTGYWSGMLGGGPW